jgi:hypothetical protein
MKKTKIIKDKACNIRVCSEQLEKALKKSGFNTNQLFNTLLSEYLSGTISLCKNSPKPKLNKLAYNSCITQSGTASR